MNESLNAKKTQGAKEAFRRCRRKKGMSAPSPREEGYFADTPALPAAEQRRSYRERQCAGGTGLPRAVVAITAFPRHWQSPSPEPGRRQQ